LRPQDLLPFVPASAGNPIAALYMPLRRLVFVLFLFDQLLSVGFLSCIVSFIIPLPPPLSIDASFSLGAGIRVVSTSKPPSELSPPVPAHIQIQPHAYFTASAFTALRNTSLALLLLGANLRPLCIAPL
jgi:hypothetical protein